MHFYVRLDFGKKLRKNVILLSINFESFDFFHLLFHNRYNILVHCNNPF